MCINNTIIGSDEGLLPVWFQAFIWTTVGLKFTGAFEPYTVPIGALVWVEYFVWNFKFTLLPIHWKIWFLHILYIYIYNIELLRPLRFKSS